MEGGVGAGIGEGGGREIRLAVLLSVNPRWCFLLCWPSLRLGRDLLLGTLSWEEKDNGKKGTMSSVPRL